MKKLLLLITALLTLGVSGAWADVTVTISDQTELDAINNAGNDAAIQTATTSATAHKYGDYSNVSSGYYTTFTTNSTSGMAGLVISTATNILRPYFYSGPQYRHCLEVVPPVSNTDPYTITITAPTGYYIKSYSMTIKTTSNNGHFSVTPYDGTATTTTNPGETDYQTINVSSVCANTTSFTVARTSGTDQELCFPFFSVILASTDMSGDVTLSVNSSTGAGTRTDGTPTTGNDFRTWTSTSSPAGLILQTGSGNSMNYTATAMRLHSNGATYTLTAPSGFYIKGYKMSAYTEAAGKNNTIQPADAVNTLLSEDSSSPTIICVDEINKQSTTFTRSYKTGAAYVNTVMTVYLIPTYKVTYNIKMGDNTVATFEERVIKGTQVTVLPTKFRRDFCTYNEVNETINEDKSVEFTATWNGPFAISETYANAHWYDMSVRSTWYVTSDQTDDSGALSTVNANALGLATNPYQWAFVGNPYNLKLYNKDKGESYVYAWTEATNQNVPGFVDAATGNTWTIKESTASGYSNAFLLTIPDYGYQVNQFGGEGGSLKIWNSTITYDAGSAFKVFDVPSDFSEYVTSEIAPYMENDATYFNWTDAARATIGYDASYKTSCTYEKYAEMKTALTSALADLNSNLNFPATGYYRLRNRYYPAKYLGQESNLTSYDDGNSKASTVVKLTKHDSENKYTIQIQGKYIQTPIGQSSGGEQVTTGVDEVWFTPTMQSLGFASFKAGDDDYGNMHCSGSSTIVGWTDDAPASHWAIEDATSVTLPMNVVGDASYGTVRLPFDVRVTSPIALCTVSISGSRAKINSLGYATEIPAGVALLMVGAASTTSVNADIITGAAEITADNDLTGTYLDKTTLADNEYIFGTKSGELGFWKMASGNKVGANKAYLVYDGAADVKGFSLDFSELTGINEIAGSNTQEKVIFDLSGRRIQEPTRGLYIVNGKKVIVK